MAIRLSRHLRRALANPGLAIRVAGALTRGAYYRAKFRILGKRVIIGRRFQVSGPLIIRGPGTVIFGDDCSVVSTWRHPTTPFTHSADAVIRFGNRVKLSSTRFGCEERIDVHDDAGISDARLMDTDFHSIEVQGTHRANTSGRSKPIDIGRNTWIGAGAMILKGVVLGENSVVGAGSVVMQSVPANCVVAGNPARVVWRVDDRRTSNLTDRQASTSEPPVRSSDAVMPAGAASRALV